MEDESKLVGHKTNNTLPWQCETTPEVRKDTKITKQPYAIRDF